MFWKRENIELIKRSVVSRDSGTGRDKLRMGDI